MCALAVIALLSGPAVAEAPCTRCVVELPKEHAKPVPLVVLLHGDRQKSPAIASWWHDAVSARGWALLSLQCPTDLACKDSWWKWNGDPSWVTDEVEKLAKDVSIDRKRIYVVGWSGGATYLSEHVQAWEGMFAGMVIHGGGVPPDEDGCPKRLPTYFLSGDKNPLHHHVELLRDFMEGCKADFVWDLVAGGDHDKEERALTRKKADAILDWLADRAKP